MHPIAAFIRYPVTVSVGVLLVGLFGVIGMLRMPMQLTPEVQIPTITIETRWRGASPQEVEREIVQEQEEQLQSVQGLTKLSSESMDSMGMITLEFLVGTNMEEALIQVNSRLSQVPEYPEEADEPVVSTSDASDRPIAWFILSPLLPTLDAIVSFQQSHPEFAAWVEPARLSAQRSPALSETRLRRLAAQHDRLQAFLSGDFPRTLPDPSQVAAYQKDHPELGAEIAAVQNAPESQRAEGWKHLLSRCATLQKLLDQELLPPNLDIAERRQFAEDYIESRFERVEGIANSVVFGGRDPEIQVVVDPYRLAARHLTIMDVRNALRGHNKDTSAGDFYEGKRRWVVRTMGQYTSTEQVEQQIVAMHDNQPVTIRDLIVPGEGVRLGYKKPDGVVQRFGRVSIAINAQRATGANVLRVMEGLRQATKELNVGLLKREGLQLTQVYDETEYIYSAVGLVNENIVLGGAFTFAVLLMFLRSPRPTLIIGLAIPISIVGTFLILHLLDRSLNVISLAGLAFAVGMLVDNAVVVLESIYQHHEAGEDALQSALRGTQEVWGAVLASTLTTLAVFLPVLFVAEEAGQLFRDIALAISASVGLSLIVSITVIPCASARLLRRAPQHKDPHQHPTGASDHAAWHTRLLRPFDQAAGAFVRAIEQGNRWIQGSLLRELACIGAITGLALAITWGLWPKVEYLPTGNRNLVFGIMLPPPGYNIDELMEMGQQVEDALRAYWDTEPESAAAAALDFPIIGDWFYVARGRQIFMGLRAQDPTRAWELVPLVQRVRGLFPGTIVVANQSSLFEQGLAAGRSIDIEITGPKLDRLVALGGRIMGMLSAGPQGGIMPGSQARPIPGLDLSSPEVHVIPKSVQAADMNVNTVDLGYVVDALVDGAYATDYYLGGDKIDLTIIGSDEYSHRTQDVASLPVASPSAQVVPLSSLADVRLSSGPEQINRRERQRAITIRVNPPAEMPLETALEIVNQQVLQPLQASGQLDQDGERYLLSISGTADKLRNTWLALRWNFLLALVITYLLMASLFESWIYPLVIIFCIPLAAVGGVVGLSCLNIYLVAMAHWWQTPTPPPQALDILTMLGFVILIGTAVNNPILIVHQALQLMHDPLTTPRRAIEESVRTRMRPIFMTTTTTVFGLAPLVLFPGAGSELYRGLGSVVLGGLAVSTIVTLILIPAVFDAAMRLLPRQLHQVYPQPQAPAAMDEFLPPAPAAGR